MIVLVGSCHYFALSANSLGVMCLEDDELLSKESQLR